MELVYVIPSIYIFINIYLLYALVAVVNFIRKYKRQEISPFIAETIKHNLESTPIFDILSDQCYNEINRSNVLGYFYGFDS